MSLNQTLDPLRRVTTTMATTANNIGIAESFSLVEFARAFGPKVQLAGPFTNPDSGEVFHSLAFEKPTGELTFVGFSSNLGELTPAEIIAQKADLQVVTLTSGTHKLCKRGENSWTEISLL